MTEPIAPLTCSVCGSAFAFCECYAAPPLVLAVDLARSPEDKSVAVLASYESGKITIEDIFELPPVPPVPAKSEEAPPTRTSTVTREGTETGRWSGQTLHESNVPKASTITRAEDSCSSHASVFEKE